MRRLGPRQDAVLELEHFLNGWLIYRHPHARVFFWWSDWWWCCWWWCDVIVVTLISRSKNRYWSEERLLLPPYVYPSRATHQPIIRSNDGSSSSLAACSVVDLLFYKFQERVFEWSPLITLERIAIAPVVASCLGCDLSLPACYGAKMRHPVNNWLSWLAGTP